MSRRSFDDASGRRRALAMAVLVAGSTVAALGPAPSAAATTFFVDTTIDSVDVSPGDGTCADALDRCSLRAAVQEANALAGADTIQLSADTHALTRLGTLENLAVTGDLDVTDALTIDGAGAAIDASALGDRALHLVGGGGLTLTDLTITGGAAPTSAPIPENWGGGILALAPLDLDAVTLTANTATTGAAIMSNAPLSIADSTIATNAATDMAGGIVATDAVSIVRTTIADNTATFVAAGWFLGASTDVTASTISGNTATEAGIVANQGLALTIGDSTIADNTAVAFSGVITVHGDLAATATISSSTIAGNTATGGTVMGSPWNAEAASVMAGDANDTVTVENSIVSAAAGPNCFSDGAHPVVSLGHNVEDADDCGFDDPTDLVDNDPLLGPLGDNGGPTETLLPTAVSPAVDAGGSCGTNDQRGVARPYGVACDTGAVERRPSHIAPFALGIGQEPGEVCLLPPPAGHTTATCVGGAGAVVPFARGIAGDNGGNSCNGGHLLTIAANLAVGLDHDIAEHSNPSYVDNDGTDPDDVADTCTSTIGGLIPNHLEITTGNTPSNYLAPGLFATTTFSDGKSGLLTRWPTEPPWAVWNNVGPYTGTFDGRPLWSFIPRTAPFDGAPGNLPATCNSNVGGLSGVTLPAWLGGGLADIQIMINSVSFQGQDGILGNHIEMANCLAVFERGDDGIADTADDEFRPLFTRDLDADGHADLGQSPRFVWLPEADVDILHTDSDPGNDCDNGSNCDFDVVRLRPAFLAGMYLDTIDWYPGEPTYWFAPNPTRIDALSAIVFDAELPGDPAEMLPAELLAGPQP